MLYEESDDDDRDFVSPPRKKTSFEHAGLNLKFIFIFFNYLIKK